MLEERRSNPRTLLTGASITVATIAALVVVPRCALDVVLGGGLDPAALKPEVLPPREKPSLPRVFLFHAEVSGEATGPIVLTERREEIPIEQVPHEVQPWLLFDRNNFAQQLADLLASPPGQLFEIELLTLIPSSENPGEIWGITRYPAHSHEAFARMPYKGAYAGTALQYCVYSLSSPQDFPSVAATAWAAKNRGLFLLSDGLPKGPINNFTPVLIEFAESLPEGEEIAWSYPDLWQAPDEVLSGLPYVVVTWKRPR